MQNEFNPVFQLKAQKIGENENEMDLDPVETKRGFNTPDSLSPVKVMGSQESVELTVVGKLKSCLAKQATESKEMTQVAPAEKKAVVWGCNPILKAKITYNPEDYPALSRQNSKKSAKFSEEVVLKMSEKDKANFAKDIAENLTSSMSSRPTLYKRAPNAREKGFEALKNGQGFEKTAMCKWGEKCRNKQKCTYAHSEEELKVRMCAFGKECNKHGCRFPHDDVEACAWKKAYFLKWEKAQKLNKLPRRGYVCRSCGKEGGCEDSHWVRDCPQKKKRSAPTKGYVCRCCGQKGGEKGAHWIQQCPKSKRSPQKSKRSPQKSKRSPQKSKRSPQKSKRSPQKM